MIRFQEINLKLMSQHPVLPKIWLALQKNLKKYILLNIYYWTWKNILLNIKKGSADYYNGLFIVSWYRNCIFMSMTWKNFWRNQVTYEEFHKQAIIESFDTSTLTNTGTHPMNYSPWHIWTLMTTHMHKWERKFTSKTHELDHMS